PKDLFATVTAEDRNSMTKSNDGIVLRFGRHHSGRTPHRPVPEVPASAGESFPVANQLRCCKGFLGGRQRRLNAPKSFSRHLVGVCRDRPVWQLVDRVRVFNECSAHSKETRGDIERFPGRSGKGPRL